jgi:uncharacterized membrane protein (DUF106 family)
MKKLVWAGLVLTILLVAIPLVHAEESEEVDLSQVPNKLAEMLNIPLFAGQLLASLVFMSLFLLPTVFACSKFEKDVFYPTAFVGFMTLGVCIAIGWLPFWILLILCMLVAFMFSGKIKGWISGEG